MKASAGTTSQNVSVLERASGFNLEEFILTLVRRHLGIALWAREKLSKVVWEMIKGEKRNMASDLTSLFLSTQWYKAITLPSLVEPFADALLLRKSIVIKGYANFWVAMKGLIKAEDDEHPRWRRPRHTSSPFIGALLQPSRWDRFLLAAVKACDCMAAGIDFGQRHRCSFF